MRRRRPIARGATLIEIMISMAVVLVGMLAMFGVLRTSITGSATAQKMMQAQTRAQTVLESIRQSPGAALVCLATNSAAGWAACEPACQAALTVKSADGCIYSMGAFTKIKGPDVTGAGAWDTTFGQAKDRHGQLYAIDGKSRVGLAGSNSSIYDILVVIGWNDDGTTTTGPGYHTVAVRSGVLPNGP